ncbi:uncharacterized protein M437DRAFT_68795 [Aureobasidium melanogenum CBS 110374]|uniref:Uncharacterized protein n=1 Tax=Aureobasidium melanogenum (strain CBS 110374) TaxID=1043003 RepID=A0A074WBF2_AURM1|nr:uncharacterized protein M437DRAFT_68795 [Aureobasidium melanogenum CBS 110374]KEQ59826.1 hypothetical protein M437DRAFT_68795 [Aureobasidium melanogenum CBS 110374]
MRRTKQHSEAGCDQDEACPVTSLTGSSNRDWQMADSSRHGGGPVSTKIRYTKVVWLRARRAFRLKQLRGIFAVFRAWHSVIAKQALLIGRTSLLEELCRLSVRLSEDRLQPAGGVQILSHYKQRDWPNFSMNSLCWTHTAESCVGASRNVVDGADVEEPCETSSVVNRRGSEYSFIKEQDHGEKTSLLRVTSPISPTLDNLTPCFDRCQTAAVDNKGTLMDKREQQLSGF